MWLVESWLMEQRCLPQHRETLHIPGEDEKGKPDLKFTFLQNKKHVQKYVRCSNRERGNNKGKRGGSWSNRC